MQLRKIIHIDLDFFFAQVEQRDDPSLRNKPVAVGGPSSGRGVLCTSNYIAREYGVRSAMPVITAFKLCPQLILLSPRFQLYKDISSVIFEIYQDYTLIIQKISIDEAYLDVTDCPYFNNDAVAIAKDIRKKIFFKTGLTASAGVSFNKLLAKIGSELFKPDGLAILRPFQIEKNIQHFPVSNILGVGKVTLEKMHVNKLFTFGDIQGRSKLSLINLFGDFGAKLYSDSRGIDHREVITFTERKSLSVERTFSEDIDEEVILEIKLLDLYSELKAQLKKYEYRLIKNIVLKLKYFDFTVTTIEKPALADYENFKLLLRDKYFDKALPIRLLGIGVKFYSTHKFNQLELPLDFL